MAYFCLDIISSACSYLQDVLAFISCSNCLGSINLTSDLINTLRDTNSPFLKLQQQLVASHITIKGSAKLLSLLTNAVATLEESLIKILSTDV